MIVFRTRTFREIVVGQHPGQHCAKIASRGAVMSLAGVMTRRLRPNASSRLLNEPVRQRMRDRMCEWSQLQGARAAAPTALRALLLLRRPVVAHPTSDPAHRRLLDRRGHLLFPVHCNAKLVWGAKPSARGTGFENRFRNRQSDRRR